MTARPGLAASARGGLALLVALALLSCGRGVSDDTLRIAFAGPTSGASARDGLAAVRAIELYLEEVKAAGGIDGAPVVLDVYDDRNDPGRAREQAARIGSAPGTLAVIGHNLSSCSTAAGEVYAERGIPAITVATTSVAVADGNDWYFRTIYNDRTQGRFIVSYLHEVLGATSFSIVHEAGEYGAFLVEVMAAHSAEVGVALSRRWSFAGEGAGSEKDLRAIVREARSTPDLGVLVLAVQPAAGVILVKELRDRGFEDPVVLTDALASDAFIQGFRGFPEERRRPGHYTNRLFVSTPFLFDTGGALAGDLMRSYLARFDHSPDWHAAFAVGAARVIVDAAGRSELLEAEDLQGKRAMPSRA